MGETGLHRFPAGLDPKAQEFRPRTNPIAVNLTHQNQIPLFVQVLPPPPPSLPHQVYYPYAAAAQALPLISDGYKYNNRYHPTPAAAAEGGGGYVNSSSSGVPCIPPQSAVPTRTLLLTSVPSEVSESVIRRELEVFGEVRGVQMERIRDGIVTVFFYDLRHAEMALKEIRDQNMHNQNRLRNLFSAAAGGDGGTHINNNNNNFIAPAVTAAARGLIAGCVVWAQFIIPSCNAVPDGLNHGTVVVFNLDPNVSSPSLREIFQAFGAVKELRETPLKKQQRFIEFYDIRDAAKALREMNGKEIHGKQVVIEFSRPGGFSRKFFNATTTGTTTTTSKSSSITNKFMRSRISRFTSHYQSLSPPSPPSRFSPRASLHIPPPRGFLKKSPNVSPNESVRIRSSDEAEADVGVSCLSICGGDANGVIADAPARIRNMKKSPTDEANTKQQQLNNNNNNNNRNRPWKSRHGKKFDTRFLINEEESNCSDSRTTVMIKNIPNKYSQKLLLNMLDNHCIHCNEQIVEGGGEQPLSSYDFVYLPIDFNNKCNVGYGFVNMTSPQATLRLYKAFHHQHWEVFNSRKICEVTYARVQGLEALKDHFKNSKFPCEMDHYLPVVFYPPRDGRQLTEPQPVAGQKQHLTSLKNSNDTDQEEEEEERSVDDDDDEEEDKVEEEMAGESDNDEWGLN